MRAPFVIGIATLIASCSVGQGTGELVGSVLDPLCELDEPAYSLNPTFFSADVIEDRGDPDDDIANRLSMRIQRGSFREGESDGLVVLVQDANELQRSFLGVPIPLSALAEAPVKMTLYLNETCDSGFPREFWRIPLILQAYSGTITFDAIYAPDIDSTETEISATFTDVVFDDPERPGERTARVSGSFTFFYQRGRPAQTFP
ncbi:hypothetical protein [Sandaracinus amylolyticus]|uniref:hypothetical protein n=1 Tax=Sandaracinus amylolyticus TaxID=927083 RepID=UPI001F253C48|nr:hypothetical protein [Sandaracinus amylolyticus]UJR80468.1 Hypothetical protein I5071_25150 [Sandaracinus amylolyticus]